MLDVSTLTAPRRSHQGPCCGVRKALALYNDDDQAVIVECIGRRDVPSRLLAQNFRENRTPAGDPAPIPIPETAVKSHRAERCCCYLHHKGE